MSYSGLADFVSDLRKKNELITIKEFVNPVLEITEVADRITKNNGKAILFENTGTSFPLLINAFGSDTRMALAMGRKSLDDAGEELENLFGKVAVQKSGLFGKIATIPSLVNLAGYLPSRLNRKGKCQEVIIKEPDLSLLPVLKCWPHDGGRFITLPMVHTRHPETGSVNVGMYRMQLLNKNTTAMHWQRHKTGAAHFEAWKSSGKKMPVSVALGGDPVYTYAATAPLPENVNEYILAGFLRRKKVGLVKCLTNDLYVPDDADIIIEGFVDPSEELVWEGPFGDHTGFYSLADWYPKFHVICVTHRAKAIYPATIVGIPPNEDAWLAKATERLFLYPVRLTLQPEIEDFHMPAAGVSHNLLIVKIRKSYPGQGIKVINSLSGAGQMMFTKYMVVVSGEVNIRDYESLLMHVFKNTDLSGDLFFHSGPLDILDHSSDKFSFGGKVGIDATEKYLEERSAAHEAGAVEQISLDRTGFVKGIIRDANPVLFSKGIPIAIVSVSRSAETAFEGKLQDMFLKKDPEGRIRLYLVVDEKADVNDFFMVAWQILGNSDPRRDHYFTSAGSIIIDGTIKAFRKGFPRKWPNIVLSSDETILAVDKKWTSLVSEPLVDSPSKRYKALTGTGADEFLT